MPDDGLRIPPAPFSAPPERPSFLRRVNDWIENMPLWAAVPVGGVCVALLLVGLIFFFDFVVGG